MDQGRHSSLPSFVIMLTLALSAASLPVAVGLAILKGVGVSEEVLNSWPVLVLTVAIWFLLVFLFVRGVIVRENRRLAARFLGTFQAEVRPIGVARQPALEEEIAEVSTVLANVVGRLRQLSLKAQAFEAEVRGLVDRAEEAKATAQLHDEDARRIASLLTSESESRFREQIQAMTDEHFKQIDGLRKAGNRMAIITLIAGVVLGWAGNIIFR